MLRVNHKLSSESPEFQLKSTDVSALEEIKRGISSGEQVFQESTTPGVVGKAIKHVAADKQITGEAIYVDDMPKFHNELYGVIVASTVAHGIIE